MEKYSVIFYVAVFGIFFYATNSEVSAAKLKGTLGTEDSTNLDNFEMPELIDLEAIMPGKERLNSVEIGDTKKQQFVGTINDAANRATGSVPGTEIKGDKKTASMSRTIHGETNSDEAGNHAKTLTITVMGKQARRTKNNESTRDTSGLTTMKNNNSKGKGYATKSVNNNRSVRTNKEDHSRPEDILWSAGTSLTHSIIQISIIIHLVFSILILSII